MFAEPPDRRPREEPFDPDAERVSEAPIDVGTGGAGARRPGPSNRTLVLCFLAVATLAALALFWSACETHYRGCVEAVDVRTRGGNTALDRLARQQGVKDCTRSPFGG